MYHVEPKYYPLLCSHGMGVKWEESVEPHPGDKNGAKTAGLERRHMRPTATKIQLLLTRLEIARVQSKVCYVSVMCAEQGSSKECASNSFVATGQG